MTGTSKDPDRGLSSALMETVADPNTVETLSSFGEIALDSILEEGLLREIPVFGTAIGVYRTWTHHRERIFAKKVERFMYGTAGVSDEERRTFREDFESKPEFREKVGETLILLLERHEDFDKSQLLGHMFAGYMKGAIDYPTFQSLAYAIDRTAVNDLRRLVASVARVIESGDTLCSSPFYFGVTRSTQTSHKRSRSPQERFLGVQPPPSIDVSTFFFYVPNQLAYIFRELAGDWAGTNNP